MDEIVKLRLGILVYNIHRYKIKIIRIPVGKNINQVLHPIRKEVNEIDYKDPTEI